MKPLPHRYTVTASATEQSVVTLASPPLTSLDSTSPAEFDGPGTMWSPETFFVGAISDCFVLTFRAIAKASKLAWTSLVCEAVGTLDKTDNVMRFIGADLNVRLVIPFAADKEKAQKLLEKAERGCLITNSLKFTPALRAEIAVEQAA
jgi:peroxiredoxin-like protein